MGVEIVREVELPGSPEAIGGVVSDLARWPEWFALHKGWSGDVPTRATVGTTFKHKVRVLGIPGDVSWKVTEAEPARRFALKGSGPMRSSMAIGFEIEPAGAGTSHVRMRATAGGLALRAAEKQLTEWLDVRADRSLVALRELLAAA